MPQLIEIDMHMSLFEQIEEQVGSVILINTFTVDPEEADAFPAEVRAEYARALRDPATVHAICEEYRAAATLDCEHDEADRGRRKISCPVLALWAHNGAVANWYDPLEVWREWADDVQGGPIRSGHFLPEEAPEETYRWLHAFLTASSEL